MIYLRTIPRDQLFAAQLELLMQHGRVASMSANVIGALAVLGILWPYYESRLLLLAGGAFLLFLLFRSLHMSRALANDSARQRPRQVFWQLITGSAVTGVAWSVTFIATSAILPASLQYLLLLITVMISAISLAVMVVIREYFLAFVFAALWPIAWWSLVHPLEQSQNALIGILLLGVIAILVGASNGIYETFLRMLSLNWQQENMARELGQIANSLRDRNRQLQEARRQLTDLANVDELTGLGNRRLINKVLGDEVNRARRSGTWLSVVLIDVDFFKSYNDHYGHPAGDEVLRQIAEVMQSGTARAGELLARHGGEEFIAVLPGLRPEDARHTAERLRDLVYAQSIPHAESQVADRVTISLGVLSLIPDAQVDPQTILDRVDIALYQAKRGGRNTVAVA